MGWAVTRVGLASPLALAMRRVADSTVSGYADVSAVWTTKCCPGIRLTRGRRGDD